MKYADYKCGFIDNPNWYPPAPRKRFMLKKGNKKLFTLLDKQQMDDSKKIKFCDHIVLNDKNKKNLKKNLSVIIKKYE